MKREELEQAVRDLHGDGACDCENGHEHCKAILANDAEARALLYLAQERYFHEPDSDARASCPDRSCDHRAGQPYRSTHRGSCIVPRIAAFLDGDKPKETKPRFNNITPGVLGQKVEAFRPKDMFSPLFAEREDLRTGRWPTGPAQESDAGYEQVLLDALRPFANEFAAWHQSIRESDRDFAVHTSGSFLDRGSPAKFLFSDLRRAYGLVTGPRPARGPVAPAAREHGTYLSVADFTQLKQLVQDVADSVAAVAKQAEPTPTPEPVKLTEEEALKLGKVIVAWYDDTPAVALVASRGDGKASWETIAMEHGNCHRFGEPNAKGWYRFEDYPALAARYVEAEAKRRGK